MRCRRIARSPVGVNTCSVGEIDVEPTVVVVIKKCDPASFRLEDVALMIHAAPHVGNIQSSVTRDIDKGYRRGRRRVRYTDRYAVSPSPQWGVQRVQKSAAEHHKRRAEEPPTGHSHNANLAIRSRSRKVLTVAFQALVERSYVPVGVRAMTSAPLLLSPCPLKARRGGQGLNRLGHNLGQWQCML